MNQDKVINYPTEFLNSLDLPGIPHHILISKIGVPYILRNINPPLLCNFMRLGKKNYKMALKPQKICMANSSGRCTVTTYSNGPNRYAI
jgi:hypothetical protein